MADKPATRRSGCLKRSLLGIAAIAVLVITFDIVMMILVRAERTEVPDTGDGWLTEAQVLEPHGNVRRHEVILVHGFGGSPFDLRPLAERLAGEGFAVRIPVVPGQTRATLAHDRAGIASGTHLAWLRDVLAASEERTGLKPVLVGFSMGGTLSTMIAAEGRVERLVLLAPFYSLSGADGVLRVAATILAPVVPVVPKLSRGRINDPRGLERYRPGSRYVSIGAFLELRRLADEAREAAGRIRVPTLLIASPNDRVASYGAMEDAFRNHSNAMLLPFPRSNHVLLYDFDRDLVVREVVEFLRDVD